MIRYHLLGFASLVSIFEICFGSIDLANNSEEIIYSVVSGSAHLPCNVSPPQGSSDEPRLILWYKDSDPQPVYSFDNRYTNPKHWSQDPKFGSRAFFRHSSESAQMIVSSVTLEDAGIYKCRVDFKQSPTMTTSIELKIIEEPESPTIMDSEGSAVMGTVGPFRLKQPLILVCLVEGGNPKPDVFWFRDGSLWDQELDPSTYEDVLQNTLVISELGRSFQGSTFECKAINNNVTKPPSSKVKITLEMPILSMTIANMEDPVTAGRTYQILCQVTGAQPPPTIQWFLDDVELESETPRLTHAENLTTSQLVFTPSTHDQDKVLTCTAQNEVFPSVNRSTTLNVYYLPVVHVELEDDNNIDPNYITEGDTITFKCLIQAHPWIWRIVWYRDGEKLVPSDGVVIEEQRLTLKNATKKMSGQYVCSAANSEGDGFSQGLRISINYKPVCVAPTIQKKDNGIDLICTVDSKPQSTTYRWLFNSSETTFEIPSAESTMFFSNYKSSTEEDHGQVLCWASNGLGEQIQPCVFRVVPLASPAPPKDCRVSNYTSSDVEVKCQSGFSGGLDQRFIMDVFETVNNTQILVATNWTGMKVGSMEQEVTLGAWGLLPDSDYIISIRAKNEKGESSPVYVGGSTRITEGATWLPINDNKTEVQGRMPLLFVIVGILVTLMIMGALLTAILAVRRQRVAKLNQIEVQSGSSGSSQTPPQNDNADLQEALLRPRECGQEKLSPMMQPTIQRKVSFRETTHVENGSRKGSSGFCSECQIERNCSRPMTPPVSPQSATFYSNNGLPPVQKAIVKAFSIDKLRPLCPVCNPAGDVPYPACSLPSPPKLPRNNNFSDDDDNAEEEVKKLNSELEELQKCLLNGAADLDLVMENKLTTKL